MIILLKLEGRSYTLAIASILTIKQSESDVDVFSTQNVFKNVNWI